MAVLAKGLPVCFIPEQPLIASVRHDMMLTAGMIDAADSCHQGLPGDGTDIGVIRGTEVIDEQSVHAGHTIPGRQTPQVFTDGMVGTVICHLADGDGVVLQREGTVALFHIGNHLVIISIPPELGRVIPGHSATVPSR